MRGRIDDGLKSTRVNVLRRTTLSNLYIVREGFYCEKCGHHKAFYKSKMFECTSCKHLQKSKKGINKG